MKLLSWLRGDNVAPGDEIRKGGVGHNEVVDAIVICDADGRLRIAPKVDPEAFIAKD